MTMRPSHFAFYLDYSHHLDFTTLLPIYLFLYKLYFAICHHHLTLLPCQGYSTCTRCKTMYIMSAVAAQIFSLFFVFFLVFIAPIVAAHCTMTLTTNFQFSSFLFPLSLTLARLLHWSDVLCRKLTLSQDPDILYCITKSL